jgi:hypothetical protein
VSDRRYKLIKQGLTGSTNFDVRDIVHGDAIRWDDSIKKWVLSDEYPAGGGSPNEVLEWNAAMSVWQLSYRMEFVTPYVPNATYYPQQTVLVGGWTMAANKVTTDYPAPQSVGAPFQIYEGAAPTANGSYKQVLSGARFTNTSEPFQLLSYQIYTESGQFYDVYSLTDGGVINSLTSFTAETSGWTKFTIEPLIVGSGNVFELVSITTPPAGVPVEVDAIYNYLTPQNASPVATGEIMHSRSLATVMQISYTDDIGGDQTALIQNLTIGDTIQAGNVNWTVQTNVDNTTFATVTVSPAINALAGVQTVTFGTVAPSPITYMEDVDYWLTSQFAGQVQGIIAIDAPYDSATINDSAYGVNITINNVDLSPDWDIVAPGSGSTSTSARTLTAGEAQWVSASATPFDWFETITTDNVWTEIGRTFVPDPSGTAGKIRATAKTTNGPIEFFSGHYEYLIARDGLTITVAEQVVSEFKPHPTVDVQVVVDGEYIVLEVRGRVGWDMSWQAVSFFDEIGL